MEVDPGYVLDQARTCVANKDYQEALEKYEWFFENSIKIERSYYGVRLSYCLAEWADLGKVYPTAHDNLIALKSKTRTEFEKTNSREAFHEFSSLCRYLDGASEVIDLFLIEHERDKEFASNIFTFVYGFLAERSEWGVCREYIGNGYKQYKKSLKLFDDMMNFANDPEETHREHMRESAFKHTKTEFLWILNMLYSEGTAEEYDSAVVRINNDLESRGCGQLFESLMQDAPKRI